jgi:membrane protein
VSLGQGAIHAIDRFQRRHAWVGFPFAVVRKYGDDQAGYLAALIAYYGFFSVFPLMLVLVSVLGIVLANSPQLQQEIIDSALAQFPIVGPTIVEEVHAITGDAVALTVGIVTALWAGLGVIQATQNAMNQVWDVPRKDRPNFFVSRLRSLLMLVVLGTTLLASTFFSGLATARSSNGAVLVTWEIGLSLLFNLVLFLFVYRVLTRLQLRWREVLPGAIAAAVMWTALQGVGGYYVEHAIKKASNVYGTLALVIGLLVWIYLGGQLTVFCAEINVVRIRRLWPRSLAPPLTDADQHVMRAGALVERRRPEQQITVTFETEEQASGAKAPPGRDEA